MQVNPLLAASSMPGLDSERPVAKKKRLPFAWVGIVLMLAFLQWPMIKGVWYRATGNAAPADHIAWRTDYSAALAESAKTGKPVLLDFSATWCPPCQEMKHDSWPDARVSNVVNSKYISVALDADAPSTRDPAARYSVESIPRILIVNSNGNVMKDGSFMSADELDEFLAAPSKNN